MRSKNIIYVTPAFPVGGLERLLVFLANRFDEQGIRQTVVSLSSNNVLQSSLRPGIRFMPMPRKGRFDRSVLTKLRDLIREEKPETVICLNMFAYIYLRMAMFPGKRDFLTKVIYQTTLHGTKKEYYLHKVYFALLDKTDLVIAASRNQLDYTRQHYRIPDDRVTIFYNGVDVHFWHTAPDGKERDRIRRLLDIPDQAKVIIMAAAFRPEKNHAGAIRALRLLHEKGHKDTILLFCGDGVMRAPSEELAASIGMTPWVRFAGSVSDPRPYYWASDIFTLCSASVETFSIAALEAMSSGLPAVLTEIGGANEMVVNGLNGYLCEPTDESIADAWAKALDTEFSAAKIHGHIDTHFNADKMMKTYQDLL